MENMFLNENEFSKRYADYAHYLRAFAESRTIQPLNWQLRYAQKDGENIFLAAYDSQDGTEQYELEVRLTVNPKTNAYLYEVIKASENLKDKVDQTPVQK